MSKQQPAKHFNMANVWGRPIGEMKRERSTGKKEYLIIQIECPNELYGNIRAYGRLWGTDKIAAFLDHFKKNPGSAYRFRGMFSQYDKEEEVRLSNFTLYGWEAISGNEFRASFLLTGIVTATQTLEHENEGVIFLHLFRQGQGSFQDIEEDFILYTLNAQDVAGLQEGDTIKVKGLLRAKEPEDYFGEKNGTIKAYIMSEINILKMQDEPAGEPY